MKKYFIILSSLFFMNVCFSQNPNIIKELPTVIPPAPTAAGLMKFEQVPVSNYTGIPDVSIPLFSSPTHSKDINVDISLKYHPAGIGAFDVSGDVGLGWSLFAGGTISRSVRDIPDEFYRLPISGPIADNGKFGIYHSDPTYHKNFTSRILEIEKGNLSATITDDQKRQYLWETYVKGMFDTEHDVWNYNFMGHSGSFIIVKNFSTNLLEVKNNSLESDLKIVNLYNSSSYEPTSFEVYDNKGYKFVFEAKEITRVDTFTDINYFMTTAYLGSADYFLNQPTEYISSFRLTKVIDNNNQVLIDVGYNEDNELIYEMRSDTSVEYNQSLGYNTPESVLYYISLCDPNNYDMQNKKLEPRNSTNYLNTRTKVKKMKKLEVKGSAKFEFAYSNDRLDYSSTGYNSVKLVSITKKDSLNNTISKANLDYFYNNLNFYARERMFLNSVKIYNNDATKSLDHLLEYDFPDSSITTDSLAIDYWGYHTKWGKLEARYDRKAADETFGKIGILKKMTNPTGGAAVFHYEPNQFSYLGDTLIDNFDNNPLNWQEKSKTLTFTTRNQQQDLFVLAGEQRMYVKYTLSTGIQNISDYRFNIYKKNGSGSYVFLKSIESSDCFNPECESEVTLPAGEYRMAFSSIITTGFPSSFTVGITIKYKQKYAVQKQYLIGGGNRIRKITYETDSDPQVPNTAAREINYEYTMAPEEHAEHSSGSLAFGFPQFQYEKKRYCHIIVGDVLAVACVQVFEVDYLTTSNSSLAFNFQTRGSDVGYKYVKVYETGNGSTLNRYTSPIDFPEYEDAYDDTYPFYPTENNDYKRGNLVFQKTFDQTNRILQSIENEYDYVEVAENDKICGVKIYMMGANCPFNYMANTYAFFKYNSLDPGATHACQDPILNYYAYVLKRNIGWAKLISKKTINYFYQAGSSTGAPVQTDETFTYNANKLLSESTTTNSLGEILKTKYFYHTGNSTGHQNRISEIERIENYRNTELLSTSRITYTKSFPNNISYLPEAISTSKGTAAFEHAVLFFAYDKYSNILELKRKDGISISYIWGYNKTQPIAKIENATNAQVASALGTSLNLTNESNMTQINNLRGTLTGSTVTTYTYLPVIGVSTITDPKGDKQTFTYDKFGRLQNVKDLNNNVMTANEYYYRTQN